MMTPQEVATTTFPKATLGGYNMAAVDVFLDKLTDDYTELYKENEVLKGKMKVLVDKMEEYHSMEDTMRSTLLTAQKMANNMIREAEEKRGIILEETEKKRAQLQNGAVEFTIRIGAFFTVIHLLHLQGFLFYSISLSFAKVKSKINIFFTEMMQSRDSVVYSEWKIPIYRADYRTSP